MLQIWAETEVPGSNPTLGMDEFYYHSWYPITVCSIRFNGHGYKPLIWVRSSRSHWSTTHMEGSSPNPQNPFLTFGADLIILGQYNTLCSFVFNGTIAYIIEIKDCYSEGSIIWLSIVWKSYSTFCLHCPKLLPIWFMVSQKGAFINDVKNMWPYPLTLLGWRHLWILFNGQS